MEKSKTKKKRRKIELFDVINTVLVVLITFLVMYPLYFCIIASLSDPQQVAQGKTLLWVKDFTLDAYRYVIREETLWIGYRNSFIYLIFGTLYNLVLTIPAAYVMSKKYLPFRTVISWYFFITMYISGGMIPTYLLIKNLGLIDNPLVMIIGAGVSCYNLIVTRQYFSTSIPEELYEATYIDGGSELDCFLKVAVPLAKPIIAVMALYYGVSNWNSYSNALIYLREEAYHPLQLVLRTILINNEISLDSFESLDTDTIEYMLQRSNMIQGMKYAIVFIASAPLLVAYPFVQKHFTKGIMIGSVKG